MFAFKRSKADSQAAREAQVYYDVANTAAGMFFFFVALRLA